LRPLHDAPHHYAVSDQCIGPFVTIEDPAAKITLRENDVEIALYLACHDFGRVTGGMPIGAQDAANYRRLPGPEERPDRAAQKRIGLEMMEKAVRDKSLEMTIKREVPEVPS
jgi:hypothetical protein